MDQPLQAPQNPAANPQQLLHELRMALGNDSVLTQPSDLLAYDGDAYPIARQRPLAVVLPVTTQQVSAVVRECTRFGAPYVPRGAGTGLSGGATATPGSIVISLARMNRILEIDLPNRRARVQAGCTNLAISDAVSQHGLHYAPDPSSQAVCTIGGNIAENAGGPHTLKYGVTVNHVTGLRMVMHDGTVLEIGGKAEEPVGLDLLGLVVGSEGTFGIVTAATVRLTPIPEAVRTLLAVFDSVESCTQCVVEILAAGVLPCALEMIDHTILVAIEDAFSLGFPRDAGAVLTIEVDGTEAAANDEAGIVREVCSRLGATEVRVAATAEDRARLWLARKKGVGTTGRLASSIVTQDGAIPRSRLPQVLADVAKSAARHGIRVCNIFHAGDGNLHPCVLYDQSDPDEAARVHAFNQEVLALCVAAGGTITGEHGVGLEKRDAMSLMFTDADLALMRRVRAAFDPQGLCNPGKLLPAETAPVRSAGTAPAQYARKAAAGEATAPEAAQASLNQTAQQPSEHQADELLLSTNPLGKPPTDVVRPQNEIECRDALQSAVALGQSVVPWGGGVFMHIGEPLRADRYVALCTDRMTSTLEVAASDSLVTCSAGITFSMLQDALSQSRQWLPLDPPCPERATLGGIVAANGFGLLRCSRGSCRDLVVAMRMVSGAGEIIGNGARVVKNTAGYDLCRLLTGSRGTLGVIAELTLRTLPLPNARRDLVFSAPDIGSAVRLAWSLYEREPELLYLVVMGGSIPASSNRARVLVLLGSAGATSHVEEQVTRAKELMLGLRLEDETDNTTDAGQYADTARRLLHGIGSSAAVRLSLSPHSAREAMPHIADIADSWVWLVPSGIVAAGTRAGDAIRDDYFIDSVMRSPGHWPLRTEREPDARDLNPRIGSSSTTQWVRLPLSRAHAVPAIIPRSDTVPLLHALKHAFDPAGALSPGRLEGLL